jgi:hypothetical protein
MAAEWKCGPRNIATLGFAPANLQTHGWLEISGIIRIRSLEESRLLAASGEIHQDGFGKISPY